MTCDCLHFREVIPQPEIAKVNKHHRWWYCVDCHLMVILKGTVHEFVRMSYGKWRCKAKGPRA